MNKHEMKDVDGGYSGVQNGLLGYYYSRVYSKPFVDRRTGSYNYLNRQYTSYTRSYSNGRTYSWSNTNYGGYSWMRY